MLSKPIMIIIGFSNLTKQLCPQLPQGMKVIFQVILCLQEWNNGTNMVSTVFTHTHWYMYLQVTLMKQIIIAEWKAKDGLEHKS